MEKAILQKTVAASLGVYVFTCISILVFTDVKTKKKRPAGRGLSADQVCALLAGFEIQPVTCRYSCGKGVRPLASELLIMNF